MLDNFKETKEKYKYESKYTISHFIDIFSNYIIRKIENYVDLDINLNEKIRLSVEKELLPFISKTYILESYIYLLENTNDTQSDYIKKIIYNDDVLKKLKSIYPFLYNFLIHRCDLISNAYQEVILNFSKDREELIRLNMINPDENIINIKRGAGDSHNEARQVIELVFPSNSIYYKPKKSDMTKNLFELQNWIEERSDIRFHYYSILNKNGYAYEEKVMHKYCKSQKEIEDYYHNLGIQIGLVYILNGTDFHQENIIAHGQYPTLIDNETLLCPAFEKSDIEFQLLNSGIIPNNQNKIDFSVLSGPYLSQSIQIEMINSQSNKWYYEKKPYNIKRANSHPSDDITYEDIYLFQKQHILTGFNRILSFFIENKKEILTSKILSVFKNRIIRIVTRHSMRYAEILSKMYHPDHIKSEKTVDKFLQSNLDPTNILYNSEKKQILNGDIPIFHMNTSSCFLLENKDYKIADISPFDQMIIKVKKINYEDLILGEKIISNAMHKKYLEVNDNEND